MSSYFNVFAPKNDKDLCWYRPKPHFSRTFPNFWRAVYVFLTEYYILLWKHNHADVCFYSELIQVCHNFFRVLIYVIKTVSAAEYDVV